MKNLKCPLCDEKVYSSIGKGCKMCGMPLKESQKNFCSSKCKVKYRKIHLKGGQTKMKKTKLLLSFLGIALVSLISMVSADAGDGFSCFGSGMMSGAYGYGGMAFGWIFGLLVVVALVLLIIWLTKQIQKKNNRR